LVVAVELLGVVLVGRSAALSRAVGLGVDLVAAAGGAAPATCSWSGVVVEEETAQRSSAASEPVVVGGEQFDGVASDRAERCP
jgi:hypothetical protein